MKINLKMIVIRELLSKAKMRWLLFKAIQVKNMFLMMTANIPLTRRDVDDTEVEGVDVEAILTKKIPTKIKSSNMATESKVQYLMEQRRKVAIDTLCETVRWSTRTT